jgi:hypothetical protein
MRDAPALSLRRRIVHLAGSGTIATLVLLLIALWVVFAIAIGDRFFSVNTLQSMAFQMPELGILARNDVGPCYPAGLNPFHHRDRQSVRTDHRFPTGALHSGSEGVAWVGVQVRRLRRGFAVAALVGLVNGLSSPISAFRRSHNLGTMTPARASRSA